MKLTHWKNAAAAVAILGSFSVARADDGRAAAERQAADLEEGLGLKDHHEGQQQSDHRPNACRRIELTAEQRTSLRNAIYEFKTNLINAKAALRIAKLNYGRTVTLAYSTREQAVESATAIDTAVTREASVKTGFATTFLFDILTGEQRENGYMCLRALERLHQHGHHHGQGHHGQGHHGQGHQGQGGHQDQDQDQGQDQGQEQEQDESHPYDGIVNP